VKPPPPSLVEVALPLPVDRTFTYALPGGVPAPGTRVLVPFRKRTRVGWVVGPASPPAPRGLRPVMEVLEEEPSVPPDLLVLARWMAGYYLVPLGVALRSLLPAVLSHPGRDGLVLAREPERVLSPVEERVVAALRGRGAPRSAAALRRELGGGGLREAIARLQERGEVRHRLVPPPDPPVLSRKVAALKRWIVSLEEREALFRRAPRQRECYEVLEAAGGEMELAPLLAQGFGRGVVGGLEGKELVEVEDRERYRDPFRDIPPGRAPAITPSAAQASAIRALVAALDEPAPLPFLLHGITGSGKTLVYIELLREVVRRGKGAVVLVPEIALTPQTVSRFRAHFGDQVAVVHSALSDGERYDAWRQLRQGERCIAVGARSAVFAPLPALGAVVVDEEHDSSYKQSEAPRYQARDLAVVRARESGAVCLLGSATPSLESWHNAGRDRFTLLQLPDRAAGGRLPEVRLVDLRRLRPGAREAEAEREGREGEGRGPRQVVPAGGTSFGGRAPDGGSAPAGTGEAGVILSPDLVEAVRLRLQRREQVILLLNRRGYSSFVQCRACGDVGSCPNCAVSLTYHRVTGRLVCHHCRHDEPAPRRCGRCGSGDLAYRGLGTEQVERSVAESFPGARIARMDVDTTGGKWSHHEILGRVERGEVDILLGTQMIAKGLDYPRVTLVGVVNADVGIHLPDFRASERTFQLLSQVAGRAGRGPLGGEVLIQTSLPEHYAIQAALNHDFQRFAEREMEERASPPYPPLVRMANVLTSSPDPELAASVAEAGAAWLRRLPAVRCREVEVVGPAPAPIERLHGRWRWHFLLRAPGAGALGRLLRDFVDRFEAPARGGDVRVAIDRDPVALL